MSKINEGTRQVIKHKLIRATQLLFDKRNVSKDSKDAIAHELASVISIVDRMATEELQ